MTSRSLIAGFLALCSLAAAAAATSEFEALVKEAGRNYVTKEGQRYLEEFQDAILPVFTDALNTCRDKPDTKEPATLLFVVAAHGTVKRLLYSKEIPFGVCVGSKLRAIKALPNPPRDSWAVAFAAANHHHEEQAKAKAPINRWVLAGKNRWMHMTEPSRLTSRRLVLLILPLRSVTSLGCRKVTHSPYGSGYIRRMRKPARIATKTCSW
jgi:hypothetical protein